LKHIVFCFIFLQGNHMQKTGKSQGNQAGKFRKKQGKQVGKT